MAWTDSYLLSLMPDRNHQIVIYLCMAYKAHVFGKPFTLVITWTILGESPNPPEPLTPLLTHTQRQNRQQEDKRQWQTAGR